MLELSLQQLARDHEHYKETVRAEIEKSEAEIALTGSRFHRLREKTNRELREFRQILHANGVPFTVGRAEHEADPDFALGVSDAPAQLAAYVSALRAGAQPGTEADRLQQEAVALRAQVRSLEVERAELRSRQRNQDAFDAQQSVLPSHPQFLEALLLALEGLLAEPPEVPLPELQAKYVQPAQMLTRPIFAKIIDLKRGPARAASRAASLVRVPVDDSTSTASLGRRAAAGQWRHRNYTYEYEYDAPETLESLIYEQDEYIRRLEGSLDALIARRAE